MPADPITIAAICEDIASGKSLRQACAAADVLEATFRLWRRMDPEINSHYMRATAERAETWAEQLMEIADGDEHTEVRKVRLDARKWMMSRILPKQYGDRPTTVVVPPAQDLSDEELQRRIDALKGEK